MDWVLRLMKVCYRCKQNLPTEDFHKDRSKKDGLNHICKKCASARTLKWAKENKEKKRANDKKHYAKCREKILARQNKYRCENSERENIRSKEWREKNPKHFAEISRLWRQAHRELLRTHYHRYNARKRNNGGSHTTEQWEALCWIFNYECLCCGKKFDSPSGLTRDHVISIKDGGTNDIGNIQPLCFRCNCTKGAKSIDYRINRNGEDVNDNTWLA